jgi:NADPH:quinone reductase-like Zn-dependent oxidoreductase
MRAACAVSISPDDPLSGLALCEVADPDPPEGWATVTVKAAALNHHDLWSLKGVGLPAERLPMVLGCDAAGTADDGTDVVVHAVIGDPEAGRGDETLDPARSLLSELHPGTLAEKVAVPRRNLVPKPANLSFEKAACLPTAWLTAYRMLTRDSGLRAGDTVLVQGAGGGVSTAAVVLGKALGYRVWVTTRDPAKARRVLELGADASFASGERLPEKVDAVVETVGRATWSHSLRSLRPGGTVVVAGATSGDDPPAELRRVFFLQLRVIGSTMGTRDELEALVDLVSRQDVEIPIDATYPLDDVAAAFSRLAAGEAFGKVVVVP